ncbi:hypothetical protein BST20_07240 [Mycobacterium branderi]|uniref:Phosphoenolpyruvate synthase n=1 Tax=Mycobacterium branderi TaxID=43348 RepID=A0AA91RJ52_9MYCO|nr:hypothetical protein BST20_07240 [Mycobacterium branderi]
MCRNLVGGKALNLGVMAAYGLPVPPGFCVSAQAYATFLEANAMDELIRDALDTIDFGDAGLVEDATATIRELVRSAKVPAEVAADIEKAYSALGEEVLVAVRSSGTAEDMADASFAGLHDTYLNVKGATELLEQIRRCWASLWTARATAYRHQNGFDQCRARIAVVVQTMVDSDVSGVMFTANPVNAATDEILINASWGLGDSVVSGTVTPDEFVVKHGDLRIRAKTLGDKATRAIPNRDTGSGTITEELPAADRNAFSLSDDRVVKLAELGRHVQEIYHDVPQDIEWALHADTFFLLQSRPITGVEFSWDVDLDDWQRVPEPDDTIWTRATADEGWTGPCSPMMYSMRAPGQHQAQLYAVKGWGCAELDRLRYWKFHRAKVYSNCELHRRLLEATAPPPIRANMLQNWLPPSWHADVMSAKFNYLDYVRMYMRIRMLNPDDGFYRWLNVFRQWMDQREQWYNGTTPERLARMTDRQLETYLQKYAAAEATLSERVWHGYVIYARDALAVVGLILAHWYTGNNPNAFGDLISGSTTRSATQIENAEVWELAQTIRESEALLHCFRNHSGDEFFERLRNFPAGREFLCRYEDFVSRHGHRGMTDRDMYFPRRCEDPSIDYEAFRALLNVSDPVRPSVLEQRVNAKREAATKEVIANLKQGPLGTLKAEALKLALDYVHRWTVIRDDERYFVDRGLLAMKRGYVELGWRLAERGLIDYPMDVFFLGHQEAFDLCYGRGNPVLDRLKIKGRFRDWKREDDKEVVAPLFLRNGQGVQFDETPDADADLSGAGLSAGRAVGTARIIKSLREIGTLTDGDILVCNSTDPGWTPVFGVISGLVLETGGRLAHGSCLAREYGLPAVQVPTAMSRISDGATITIDGTTGAITVDAHVGAQNPPVQFQAE